MAGEETEFDFMSWATESKLKRRTTDCLNKGDYGDRDVLLIMTSVDVAALDISAGQARLLCAALGKLGNPAFAAVLPTEPQSAQAPVHAPAQAAAQATGHDGEDGDGPTGGSQDDILRAGEAFDRLWRDPAASLSLGPALGGRVDQLVTGAASSGLGGAQPGAYDPHMILTIRASSRKALQARDFVPDSVKQRLARRRRETLRWVESADGAFSIQADDQAPSYLTQAEWGAANMRVMFHLLKGGELRRDQVEDYMAFTVAIHELASRYDWASVLEYDIRYREQQAEHGFRWGSPAQHLESLLLLPKRREHQPPQADLGRQRQRGKQRTDGRPTHPLGQPHQPDAAADSKEPCRLFLTKGVCSFGDRCRYSHVVDA